MRSAKIGNFRVGFFAACLVIAGIAVGAYWSNQRLVRSYEAVADSHSLSGKIAAVDTLLKMAENSVYTYVITGREERLDRYEQARAQLPKRLREIEKQVRGYPKQKSALREFRRLYAVHQDFLANTVTARQSEGPEAAARWIRSTDDYAIRDVLNVLLNDVQREQRKVMARRSRLTFERSAKMKWVLLGASGMLWMLIVWVFGLLRRESGERAAVQNANARLETFLRSIIDRTPYMVWVKEAQTLRISLVNRAAVEWFGRSEAELIDSNDYDLMPPEQARLSTEQDRLVLRQGAPVDIAEARWVGRENEARVLHIQKIAIPDEDGLPAYLLTICEDITLRKEAQRMIEASRDAALQSERLKSEFIRNMSHEIRTPLTIVMGNAQRLMMGELSDDQRAVAERIERASGALAHLAKSILDFSRMETGTYNLEPQEMNIRQTLDNVLTMFAHQAETKGIHLVGLVPPSVPQALLGDGVRVGEVLTELVGNALKFTERGEVIVRVVETEATGETYWLTIKVSDTGIGVTDAVKPHLFEPFRQGDGSPTRKFGGTGLGLAICKRIVELMGGEIGVISAANEGATFWCKLPFRKLTAPGPVIPGSTVHTPNPAPARQSAA